MMSKSICCWIAVLATFALPALAGDWPQWRYDAARTATAPDGLPARLYLEWTSKYPKLEPAWEDPVNRDRMPFDRIYEPVVMGRTMFIGSSLSDKVTALDTRTGVEKWRFYAGGPVRLPPVAGKGKVCFVSDDGYLYCLNADTGLLLWKIRGGPGNCMVLGNSRMISAWPARGGPVLKDGIVYFAASIWPFMGIFIHAVDAETGKIVWTNDGSGAAYMNQPHAAPSFGSVAPQGALAVTADKLLVPGGRSVPACFDRKTGKFLYYHLSGSRYHEIHGEGVDSKREGGSHVSAIGGYYFNHRGLNTSMYDLETGEMYIMWKTNTYPVLTEHVCYLSGNPVVAYSLKSLEKISYEEEVKGGKTDGVKTVKKYRWAMKKLWECPVDGTDAIIKAGNRLYVAGTNVVAAIDLSDNGVPEISWTASIEGTAGRIIAADDRLFVITMDGRIYAFGAEKRQPKKHPPAIVHAPPSDRMSKRAEEILKVTKVCKGYCLAFGLDTGRLVEELVRNSELHVIAVDPDAKKVAALRRRLDDAGLYGARISVHVGDATTFEAPPYVAVLTVFEDLKAAAFDKGETFLKKIFCAMRPYGGVACLQIEDKNERSAFAELVKKSGLAGARVTQCGEYTLLAREGPLPDSSDWTHQYGNIANTAKSDDKLVKLPFGLLWFGGNSHHDVLPRHAHGPPEQVIGGRLFIEGINMLSARDVYTGRVLWKRIFSDLGTFRVYYDESYRDDPLDTTYNQAHIPGANARGANYVATLDKLYLVEGGDCWVLDPATGDTITTFSLPAEAGTGKKRTWGYIGVYQDLLIAGSEFVLFSQQYKQESDDAGGKKNLWHDFDTTSSKKLVVMDRHTGKVRWTRDSKYAFRHNAIAVGAGKLFCIDNVPEPILASLRRRAETPHIEPLLLALDVRTGKEVWGKTENVFGTWLGYSKEYDILLQSGRNSRDMIQGEPSKRMIAYRGKDGAVVWDKPVEHSGPCMIHGDTIYLNALNSEGTAVSLLTGERAMYRNPLTGEETPWRYQRAYGCNSATAGEHLLTFRSGAAGYYDLLTKSGTGNLGGFKSGCTANLIPANGVLNAPDYTRTCTCSYQNQTSLALVHNPAVEVWAFSGLKWDGKPVRRVGINFGAPGDRMAENGTLWLDYPSVGGPSPDVPVSIETEEDGEPEYFRRHSSVVKGSGLSWVAASGVIGLKQIAITLAGKEIEPRSCTVRLHFAEPDDIQPGERVFSVKLQNQEAMKDFDIVKAAGGSMRAIIEELNGIKVRDTLTVSFTYGIGRPLISGIEFIEEGTVRK